MLVKIDAIFFFFVEQAAFSTVDKEMEKRTNNIGAPSEDKQLSNEINEHKMIKLLKEQKLLKGLKIIDSDKWMLEQ